MKKIFAVLSLVAFVFASRSLMATTDDFPVSITAEQANTPDHPISVLLNNDITISLSGEESNSKVYCSGAGSQHGYRWEYDNGSGENDVLTMTSSPIDTIHTSFFNEDKAVDGWNTKQTSYHWTFFPKKSGLTTLTFKKYGYSNAMVRNLDGSSSWKDLVEMIHFTINVTDYSAILDDGKMTPWQGDVPVKQ